MDLRDYLSVVRRRKWTIIFGVIAVASSALLASSLQTPVYEARARVLLETPAALFAGNTNYQVPSQVRTELEVLNSAPVSERVREKLGVAPRVTAVQVSDTQVILVKARSTNPKLAANLANSYAESYIDYRRQKAIDNLAAAGEAIQVKVDEIRREIAEYDAANPRPVPAPGTPPFPESPERAALESQRFFFEGRLDQLSVDAQLKDGGSQLVAPATEPTTPIEPKPVRNALLGVGVGLIFGVAVAFLFEHLDDSVNQKEDLQRIARDVAVVGVIPAVGGWRNRTDGRVVSRTEPSSPAAEAYRTLRTSVQFLGLDRPLKKLQFTSPSAGEGKSTTVANLAVTLSQAGYSVVVVSCDLRRPRIHDFFGLPNTIGFTSVLLRETPLSNALQDVPDAPGLRVLASGPLPPNPSELLASHLTTELLAELESQFDLVLVDSPPVLPVTDAVVLASKTDATLMIANAGSTSKKSLARAFELLRQVSAPVVGSVLNGATAEGAYGYAYSYYRYDRQEEEAVRRKAAKKSAKSAPMP
jgi:succinoglycan biosynthesis transport protein ExoP